ncbi:RDD family protein [Streptomyces sp. ID03-2B]|uniref:RDD family protein n=2 Tax=Streptomyces TaxID=1883 RepID=A0AB33KNG4_9ACTN|nr:MULTISPECIES: RDD family protein [Streptomyces]WSV21489.1 RDD family protein [Streptomyces fimicarius]MCL6290113.1 RDD family protein [Streptomyces sp. 43Y-GA-1]MCX4709128.1 RDD family protein [Streptomyces griseus]MDX3343053.1 RDD family protein [Streptomyces sp. ME02-6979.5a]MDX3502933.1 RDD family protein [Streptomyces sp. ATCC51928]
MSNDQPTPGQPPEDDDPFLKKPQEPSPPSEGQPYGSAPPPPPPPPPPNDPYGSGGGFGAPDPLAGMPPLAEPGKRILARLIDFLIISIPLYLISLPWGGAVDVNGDGDDGFGDAVASGYSGHQLLWSIIGLVVYVAYDTYFTHKDGRTVGKRLLKLRVAMLNDGRVPDTGAALMRAVVLWAPALLCCPCLWWLINIVLMFTDKPYRQGLQDKAAKTVVVVAR